MNQHELLTRLGNLKDNFRKFFAKNKTQLIKIDEKKTDHYIDDLQLTINRDPYPDVNVSSNRTWYLDKNESL
jgi:hypothetical protein